MHTQNALLGAVCQYLNVKVDDVLDYDEFEYFLCELRRRLWKPISRVAKAWKTKSPIVQTLWDRLQRYLRGCQAYSRDKIRGSLGTYSFAQRMASALKVSAGT
jgi:hypothetical protein